MKLPSIQMLVNGARTSFLRFPMTMIAAFTGVVTAIYLTENNSHIKNFFPYINFMLSAGIGISLYFSASIFSERRGMSAAGKRLLLLCVTLLLVVLYFTLPGKDSTHNTALPYIKFGIYAVTAHLIVAFIPFLPGTNLNGFWQYNKTLFIRILLANLYSSVLYLGLILALAALHWLFDISIHNELYLELNIVIFGIFNTWFFLSGIPEDFNSLETLEDYPKELKVFAQFILLSLLLLYVLILYVYGAKIMLSWDWPKGIVSWLVICVSILGSLTFLLLYPYGKLQGNQWISKASRIFYIVLIPLLVLLFIAVLMRIGDYGITIKRYVVLFLGVWLSLVCAYTISGKVNIRFIPMSLAILLMLISFGPWGMFSVSEHYQVGRLKSILEKASILKNGKIQNEFIIDTSGREPEYRNEKLLSDSLHNEVYSILDYMDDFHGFSAIRGWYSQDIDSVIDSRIRSKSRSFSTDEAEIYMNAMGLRYETRSESETDYVSFNAAGNTSLLDVTGYDYVIEANSYMYNNDGADPYESELCTFELDSVKYSVNYKLNKTKTVIIEAGDKKAELLQEPFRLNLGDMIQRLYNESGSKTAIIAPEKMEMKATIGNIEVKLKISSIELTRKNNRLAPSNLNAKLLVRKLK